MKVLALLTFSVVFMVLTSADSSASVTWPEHDMRTAYKTPFRPNRVHRSQVSTTLPMPPSALPAVVSNSSHRVGVKPQFSKCADVYGDIYETDTDYSYTEPTDVNKGDDVTLHMWGVMNLDEKVSNLEIDVYWNYNFFHREDHARSDVISEGEALEVLLSVFVPGFAPSGYYLVLAILQGGGNNLGCLNMTFTF